jgi:hypothetical protein
MIRVALRLYDPSETSYQGMEAGIMDILRKLRTSAIIGGILFRIVYGKRNQIFPKINLSPFTCSYGFDSAVHQTTWQASPASCRL